jgi:hypothetical protein
MVERDEFLADVRLRLEQAQAVYKHHYDRHHRDVRYEVGDWARLRLRQRAASSLHVVTSGKLKSCFYRPYHITALINDVAYQPELPPRARLHDVFHVGLLNQFVGTHPFVSLALPQIYNGAAMPESEHVLRSRLARGVHQLLVHWKGVTAASAMWEGTDSFINHYPGFQLEDELLVERGGGMSCGAGIINADLAFRCSNHWRRVAWRDLGKQACRLACQARIKEFVSVVSKLRTYILNVIDTL